MKIKNVFPLSLYSMDVCYQYYYDDDGDDYTHRRFILCPFSLSIFMKELATLIIS